MLLIKLKKQNIELQVSFYSWARNQLNNANHSKHLNKIFDQVQET